MSILLPRSMLKVLIYGRCQYNAALALGTYCKRCQSCLTYRQPNLCKSRANITRQTTFGASWHCYCFTKTCGPLRTNIKQWFKIFFRNVARNPTCSLCREVFHFEHLKFQHLRTEHLRHSTLSIYRQIILVLKVDSTIYYNTLSTYTNVLL